MSLFNHPFESGLDITFKPREYRKRPSLIELSVEQILGLKSAHSSFVDKIQWREYAIPYIPGQRRIVTTAGGRLLPATVVSILMLRQTGSTLPVEVFLSDRHEWDVEIHDNVLLELNAKCLVIQDVLDQDEKDTPPDQEPNQGHLHHLFVV